MRGKAVDEKTKKTIQLLRQHGHSLPEISKITGRAKTTVLRYIQGIEIMPEYRLEWAGKRGGSRKRMLLKEKEALEEGRNFLKRLNSREQLLFLSALYWGEGSKKDFSLSNSDPFLVRAFVSMLKECLKIDKRRLRISIRIYEDLDSDKCLDFWSKIVGIPKENFVNVNILKGKKKGKLEFGMCRVRLLKGGDVLKKIQGINRAIQELFAPIA